MAWRKPTEDDLVATLSREEIEAFKADGSFSSDPVEQVLARTVEMVRGKCATSPAVRLCPDVETIPGSLMAAAMDFAAYDVLTRFNVTVNEDRRRKREWAQGQFDAVASGKLSVESWSDDVPASTPCGTPSSAPATPFRLLD